jgi:hypothetical protein
MLLGLKVIDRLFVAQRRNCRLQGPRSDSTLSQTSLYECILALIINVTQLITHRIFCNVLIV